MSYTPNLPNSNTVGYLTTSGQSITITVPDGHSSWTVYASSGFSSSSTISFEGSPDGINWHALNGRRNTDAFTNDTTNLLDAAPIGGTGPTGGNPSNWRGVIGAIAFFRVRYSIFTSGDIIRIQIITSAGVGATFLNAGLPASTNLIGAISSQFYFQSNTGRAYGAPLTPITSTIPVTAQNVLSLYNPTSNTKTIYMYRINHNGNFGANNFGRFDRIRFTSGVNPSGGNSVTPVSRNGSPTPSIALVRTGTGGAGISGVTITGATFYTEKSLLITSGGIDASNEDGGLILPPGSGLVIQYTTAASGTTIASEFVWHEL